MLGVFWAWWVRGTHQSQFLAFSPGLQCGVAVLPLPGRCWRLAQLGGTHKPTALKWGGQAGARGCLPQTGDFPSRPAIFSLPHLLAHTLMAKVLRHTEDSAIVFASLT